MQIKKIVLENIRSHLNSEIEFKPGKTLLAGNIGSGKSSILLAIDFALFGITKGVLSGSAVLRNGKDSGKVQLHLQLEDSNIIIERRLKRSSQGVQQEPGYLIINGIKQEKSATELKQAVLELLNYPQELLTKSKGLIYRYTVYTPQEEMKQILFADSETRLEILRKIFDIDKYKRIKENSKIFLTSVREKRKEFSGIIQDLELKKTQHSEKTNQLSVLKQELESIEINHNEIIQKLKEAKNKLAKHEENKETLQKHQKELEIKKSELFNKSLTKQKSEKELFIIIKDLESLEKELENFQVKDYSLEINQLEEKIKSLESEIKPLITRKAEISLTKLNSQKLIEKISRLSFCPTCSQEVNQEHKHSIQETELKSQSMLKEDLEKTQSSLLSLESSLESLKNQLSKLLEINRNQSILNLKSENLKYKQSIKEKLEKEILELASTIKAIEESSKSLQSIISSIDISLYHESKKLLESAQEQEKQLHIKKSTKESEIISLSSQLSSLHEEIKSKEKSRENLESLSQLYSWINDYFIPSVELIERKVMLKLHLDFNILFQKWFETLIGNDNLKISLSEDFSPKILQDGYDLEYENLSGGEKTAAALAYRLSLNQVINNLMSNIKTRDLLILDEPTDGFSDEQLEKMKLVLDELKIRQIIIVSHEDKIESFVDNIIRFEKDQHVTKIV